MMGSGQRVPLRFEPTLKVSPILVRSSSSSTYVYAQIRGGPKGVTKCGFFPGMIAGLKGRNGGGGWFAVDEVICVDPSLVRRPS